MEKAWTFYWLDGHKSVLFGNTVEEAFNKSYGGGALSAVDFYTEHITSTHYWVPSVPGKRGCWEEKFAYHITIDGLLNLTESIFIREMVEKLNTTFSGVTVVYPTKDVLTIQKTAGLYHPEGYVLAVEVSFGEYNEGNYGSDTSEPGDHYFMTCSGEYFSPENLEDAVKAFVNRAKSMAANKYSGSKFSTNIPTIAAKQQLDKIIY